jgi:DNA polymerase III delta prime subunit
MGCYFRGAAMTIISDINPEEIYALIVGIEKYQAGHDWNLNGPAKDAINFADWLLERRIKPENIHLFVSPLEQNSDLLKKTSLTVKDANREDISDIISHLLDKNIAGQLLYVFWGGHGIITKSSETKRRLLFSNSDNNNYKNLDFNSLQEALKNSSNNSGFARQVYLIDTCANSVYTEHFDITRAEKAGQCFSSNGDTKNNNQFVLFASSEYEIATNENEVGTGSFSKAVLQELEKLPEDRLLPDMEDLTKKVQEKLQADGNPKPIFRLVGHWDGSKEEYIDSSRTIKTQLVYSNFFAYDNAWVGRDQLVTKLNQKLRGSCRLLLILGLTGIGKTALAERLAVELQDWFGQDWKNRLRRANFDNEDKATDFASVAAGWLEDWGEKLLPEEKKPELLLYRLGKYLRENQVLVLIDSLERLLTGNQAEGWGDFADECWKKFFLTILSAESCKSRLIITSQDLPLQLVNSQYTNFWYRQILYGLTESEQVALFEKTGLDVSEDSSDRFLLLRIAKAYKGHPLVLRVIIGEILNEPFNGDVQAYWNDERENTSQKIEEVETALAEAEQGNTLGEKDEWKLHKLTRQVREQVNKQRLQIAFNRLARDVKDAYILICAASVYRAPEKEEYWLKHLFHWLKRLEQQECSKDRQIRAIEELSNRFLVEETLNHNKKRVLGQHNLIRSVAIEHRKQLLE